MDLPKRKPTRLKGYDYSTPGMYFLTICVKDRRQQLGKIVGCGDFDAPQKILSEYGENIWQSSCNDHIIRGKQDYQKIWEYIDTNVLKWEKDCFYNSETEQ